MGLQGIKINNNFKETKAEFDLMIKHMNDIVKTPINITVNINQMQHQMGQMADEITKTQHKIEKVFKDSKISGEGYTDLQKRVDEIKSSVDEYAKVTIQTYKNTNNLKNATIEYTDSAGKAVKETMAWTEYLDKANNISKKIFQTTGFTFTDNIAKANKESQNLTNSINKFATESIESLNKLKTQFGEVVNTPVINTKINELQTKIENLKLNPSQSGLEQLKAEFKSLSDGMNGVGGIDKAQQRIDSFVNGMNSNIDRLKVKYKELVPTNEVIEIESLMKKLESSEASSMNDIGKQIDDIKLKYQQMVTGIKASGSQLGQKDTMGWADQLFHDIKQMATWAIGGTAIFGTIHSIQDAISKVTELDSSISTLKITMNGTTQQFNNMANAIQKTAIATGSDVKSVMEAAKVYANMQESTSSILAKTKSAIMLSNVTGLNTGQVTDSIHAILNEYNMGTEDIEKTSNHIADSLVMISKNMAMDFGQGIDEITKGIQIVGTVANQVGKQTSDETEAMIGAIVERTRLGGEQVANGMKTIIARLYQSKSIDPDVTDEDLSNMSKILNQLGISVRDTSGAFVPLNKLLQEISDKEKGMTDSQRQAINIQAAGVRQANIFATALDTIGKSTDLANMALNSNGELMQANSKYMDTISAKVKTLGSLITTMWQQGINSSAIKGLLDGTINLVKNFGNLHTVITLVGAGLLLFKGADILNFFTSLPSKIEVSSTSLSLFGKISTVWRLQQAEMLTINQALGFSFTALGNTIKASFASNPLGWIAIGISAVVMAVDAWNNRTQKQIDKMNELSSKIQKEQSDIKDLKDSLTTLDELHSKTVMTNDDKTQLKNINDQLAEKYPELISYYDKESKSFQVNIDKLKELIKKKQELAMQENANNLQSAKDSANQAQKTIDDDKNSLARNKKYVYGNSGRYERDLTTEDRNKLFEEVSKNEDNLAKSNQIINQATKYINDYIAEQTKAGISVDKINSELLKYGYTQTQIDDAIKMGTDVIKENTKAKDENADASQKNTDTNQAYTGAVKTFSDNLSKAKNDIKDVNELLDKHAKSGEWDLETVIKLSDTYPELLNVLGNEKALEQELIKIKNDRVNSAKESLTKQIQNEQNYLNEIFKGYNTDISNYKTAQEAKLYYANTYAQRLATLNEAIIKSESARQSAIADGDREAYELAIKRKVALVGVQLGIQGQIDQVSTHIDNYFKLKDISLNADKFAGTGSSSNDGKGSAQDTYKQKYDEAVQIVKNAESKITDIIKQQVEARKKAIQDEFQAKKDALDKEKKLYDEQYSEDNYNKDLKKEQDALNSISTQITSASRDKSLSGIARLQALQDQYKTQQQKIDDMISQHSHENGDKLFDEQAKQLEEQQKSQLADLDKYTDDQIKSIAKNALITGSFQDLNGNIVSVKDAYIDFENRFGDGMTTMGKIIEDNMIKELEKAKDLINSMDLNGQFNPSVVNTIDTSQKLPSYDIGTPFVPNDMVAKIHKGEMIIPAKFNPISHILPFIPKLPTINKSLAPIINFNQPLVSVAGGISSEIDLNKVVDTATEKVTSRIMSEFNNQAIYAH